MSLLWISAWSDIQRIQNDVRSSITNWLLALMRPWNRQHMFVVKCNYARLWYIILSNACIHITDDCKHPHHHFHVLFFIHIITVTTLQELVGDRKLVECYQKLSTIPTTSECAGFHQINNLKLSFNDCLHLSLHRFINIQTRDIGPQFR